ncbi:hypothetical protein TWF481_009670 [Arthrobotrys musiformis]|uniref:Toprim domain-containing protein n=1 Tax=Arthrobotrys musiformis TaxID=47236 RepID=A0AAV9W5S2_9PEZI
MKIKKKLLIADADAEKSGFIKEIWAQFIDFEVVSILTSSIPISHGFKINRSYAPTRRAPAQST